MGVRWVDVDKGDATATDYRSRLVGQEFATYKDDSLYAATPPLEALRMIISHVATGTGSSTRQIMINDVRRAYFYAQATRDLYIELPAEDELGGPDMLGKLKLNLYGTRDAASNWQEKLAGDLLKVGFTRGVGHPSVFHHAERHVCVLVHGDDYVSGG